MQKTMNSLIIAVDGTAGSGKGAIAKSIAKEYHLQHFDTGMLYRYIAYIMIESNLDINGIIKYIKTMTVMEIRNIGAIQTTLQTEEIGKKASKIAKEEKIRKILVDIQRDFAKNHTGFSGSILDGRDIGTVILKNASIKFFVDAKISKRAKRRAMQLNQKSNDKKIIAKIKRQIENRDKEDKEREVSPLIRAEDAFFIDNSEDNFDNTLKLVYNIVNHYIKREKWQYQRKKHLDQK